MNNSLLNIPQHTNCKNCGECCGVIPASALEVEEIRAYLEKHEDVKNAVSQRNAYSMDCPFRSNEERKCDIYPVRPLICRLMGVCKGLDCVTGTRQRWTESSLCRLQVSKNPK